MGYQANMNQKKLLLYLAIGSIIAILAVHFAAENYE